VDFFYFFGPVKFASTQVTSSPPFFLPGGASPSADVTTPCHASFPWSQDELTASTSPSGNVSSHRLPSRAKIEALNLHHYRRSPSLDRPTLTLHCYKKVISTLVTLPITQPHLHFTSSLARAQRQWSSTRHCHFL
jgi:hypothetical protein